MTKRLVFTLMVLAVAGLAVARKTGKAVVRQTFAVGFYNLENLFDTIHDAGKNDYEFLPDGTTRWTAEKYRHKLRNMSRALADIGTDRLPRVGCAVIGVAEVENERCLADLLAQPELRRRGYRYVHVEGPDQRGIDCALLYQPSLFQVGSVSLVPYRYLLPQDSARATRGFLVVSGLLGGSAVAVVVCHLPSRGAGSYYRQEGARQLLAVRDSLLSLSPKPHVLIMGDMNDDPQDPSMADCLRGRRFADDVTPDDMYNPWWQELAKGNGTLTYQGAWNLFDQILLSPSLLASAVHGEAPALRFDGCQVFRRDYLLQDSGPHQGSPLRTFGGGQWLDGYSDHLPTVVYLTQ